MRLYMTRRLTRALAPAGALWVVGCAGQGLDLGQAPGDGGAGAGIDGGPIANGDTGGPDASDGCRAYEQQCNGVCIPVTDDPMNCGGCQVQCAPGEVCSGVTCASVCLPGLTGCNGACVDLQNDSENCGACGVACPTGEGCVAGACVAAIGAGTSPLCAGGGPPIELGDELAACVAQTRFTWALCSCQDLPVEGNLLTDAYDSTQGTYAPGGIGGSVGADGTLQAGMQLQVGGSIWASSPLVLGASAEVSEQLRVGGGLTSGTGATTIGDDAYINGDLVTGGTIAVAKTLHVPPSALVAPGVTYSSIAREAVNVTAPCDCAATDLLPIASWISAALPPNNDNATIGLDPNVLSAGSVQPTRIDLPCGRFYLDGIDADAAVTIAVHGNVALFVDGDVAVSGALAFVVDPPDELDLVIGGIVTANALVAGSPSYPALSRVYIGGSGADLELNAGWRIAANVYAPGEQVSSQSGYTLYGALFAAELSAVGDVAIHFDKAVVGNAFCPPPAAGAPPSACQTCLDCGNQACVGGACGACSSDDQCCAPLLCQSGRCVEAPE
jgi:Stigma-specific protein, Stig1